MAKAYQEKFARRYLELLKALDEAARQGPWEKTLILTAIGKKITRFRDELSDLFGIEGDFDYESELQKLEQAIAREHSGEVAVSANQGLVNIYIAVYSANGQDLKSWDKVALSLTTTVVSRPIYRSEADVQAFINSKGRRANDGYLVVSIEETMILKPFSGQLPTDRLGHELLVLKRGAIKRENMRRLVIASGHFAWQSGHWVDEVSV